MARKSAGLALMLAAATISCGWDSYIGGKTITVSLRNAEGFRGGEKVYLSGVEIGKTDAPTVLNGRASVPVQLMRKHKAAVPSGTIFLTKTAAGQQSLIGYSLGKGTPSRSEEPEEYQGASNYTELVLLVGAAKATVLWNLITQ